MIAERGTPLRYWGGLRACLALALGIVFCLALAELLLALFPVTIRIVTDERYLVLAMDGQVRVAPIRSPLRQMQLEPGDPPMRREYQIDGSDTTTHSNFDERYFRRIRGSPYYRLQSFLRDESSYSSWRNLRVYVNEVEPVAAISRPAENQRIELPGTFVLTIDLYRPEVPRAINFQQDNGGFVRLEINRADKYVGLSESGPDGSTDLGHWYYPHDVAPPLAELAYTALRSVAVGLFFALLLVPIAAFLPGRAWPSVPRRIALGAVAVLAVIALGLSGLSSFVLFDRAPHVLDAVSYYFQGKVFADGMLTAPAPPSSPAFQVPFFVIDSGKWYSQYPPGTSIVLAIGMLARLPWLVEPVLGVGTLLLTFLAARRQYGLGTAVLAAALLTTSPFLHLQAGTFMSHVPAMFWAAAAVYCATRYQQSPRPHWAFLAAAAIGAALLTREIVAGVFGACYGVAILASVVTKRRWRIAIDAPAAVIGLAIFVGLYLAYNQALTGSFRVLPRHMFNLSDTFGFGREIGFYGMHTVASGLANTDMLLTSWQMIALGWPFYATLALAVAPFLLRRPSGWDLLNGVTALLFVAAYVGYFYHGIAIGPRYYFEALPLAIVLVARGFSAVADRTADILTRFGRPAALGRARLATALLAVVLVGCNAGYFAPRQVDLYHHFVGLSGGKGPALGDWVTYDLAGRKTTLTNAVVATRDWSYFTSYLAAMNCARLEQCGAIFIVKPDVPEDLAQVRAAYASRDWYEIKRVRGVLVAVPEAEADSVVESDAPTPTEEPTPDEEPTPQAVVGDQPTAEGEDSKPTAEPGVEIESTPVPREPVSTVVPGVKPSVTFTADPASLVLDLPFDGTALTRDGIAPIEGRFRADEGPPDGGVLLGDADYLIYDSVAVSMESGTIAFWVMPLWNGNDGGDHVFVELGRGDERLRLAKDGADNFRYDVWTIVDGVQTGQGTDIGVPDWQAGQWHHVVATWKRGGQLRLYFDGILARELPANLPQQLAPYVRVGTTEDGAAWCECVVDDLIISTEELPPNG